MATRQVWRWNKREEMNLINDCVNTFNYVAVDTEFPGCLVETRRDASDEERYNNMRFSVDRTKVIQLGLTFFDTDGNIGGTWDINFRDFGDVGDASNPKSIGFLKSHGLNLEKIREEGIWIKEFFSEFNLMLKQRKDPDAMTWVTFHGAYDIGYVFKGVTGKSTLPMTPASFSIEFGTLIGSVYDLKEIADCCEGITGKIGLEGLGKVWGLSRVGTAHHAGSDSLLTAKLFAKWARSCINTQDMEGLVYGFGFRIIKREPERVTMHPIREIPQLPPIHHIMMMTRCYGPPPPRPMFVPPFGGYVFMPQVPMY